MQQVETNKIPVSIFTPNMHYLTHLPEMVKKLGPPIGFSARCLERTIGDYKGELRSKVDPGVEAGNNMVKHAVNNLQQVIQENANVEGYNNNSITGKTTATTAEHAPLGQSDLPLSEVLQLIGADEGDMITVGTKLLQGCEYYGSMTSHTKGSRLDYLFAFKVMIER
jgi:hypothetical protein